MMSQQAIKGMIKGNSSHFIIYLDISSIKQTWWCSVMICSSSKDTLKKKNLLKCHDLLMQKDLQILKTIKPCKV